jgi:2,4-dichlorophenol 6-monooxygenase
MTTVPTVETEVLIVGSGPAGASAALALSTYPGGTPTHWPRPAFTPPVRSPRAFR